MTIVIYQFGAVSSENKKVNGIGVTARTIVRETWLLHVWGCRLFSFRSFLMKLGTSPNDL
jgi:hypothetical protein